MVSDEGKYVSRASGVERVPYGFDGDPGLLVEAASRTNLVNYSTDPNQWSQGGVSIGSAIASIVNGESAYNVSESGGGASDRVKAFVDSTFSSSKEVLTVIIEIPSSSITGFGRFRLQDTNNFREVCRPQFDLQAETFSLSGEGGINLNARLLTSSGPNGGKVYRLHAQYDPTDVKGGDVSGENRVLGLEPDLSGNGNGVIFHHAQVEEAPNASSPIVTQGSPVTRSADDYAISVGDWFNHNEGTFFAELTPRFYEDADAQTLLGNNFNRYFFLFGGEVLFRSQGFSESIASYDDFETTKVALSLTFQKVVGSVNGQSNESSVKDTNLLSPGSSIKLGSEGFLGSVKRLLYVPRALPESTLNAITS